MDYLLPGDEIVQVNNNNTHNYTTHCTEIFIFNLQIQMYLYMYMVELNSCLLTHFCFVTYCLQCSSFLLPSLLPPSLPPSLPVPLLYKCEQALGKSAVNMKLSHFKQILKSCRGGVAMTIHRMPGDRRTHRGQPLHHRLTVRGREGDRQSLSEFNSPSYQSYQAPGTPGSNLSETTGYYSTQSTSLPSVCSAAISPITPDMKTGLTSFGHRPSPSTHQKSSVPSQMSTSQHSGYETDQTSFESHFRTASASSPTNNNGNPYPSRPSDISSYSNRPLYLGGTNTSRTRMSSQSSYGGSSQLSSSVLSPKPDATTNSRFPYTSSSRTHNHSSLSSSSAVPHSSFSVDRLESRAPGRRTSGDRHMTAGSSLGPHSMSLSNVYRIEVGKRTNV